MPLIHKDIPAPTVWPPPVEASRAAEGAIYSRRRDPVGHRVHLAMAMVYLALLPLATAAKDGAFLLLLLYTLIRLPNLWRAYPALVKQPILWAFLAWTAWQALAILWTPEPARPEGWENLRTFRMVLTPLLLWPVLEHAPLLIGSFLVGVFGQNVLQALQALEIWGFEPGENDRLRGWLHPIQLGGMCLAAICFYAVAALRWRPGGVWRWVGAVAILVGGAAAALGLVFSGSRGPWLAAAIVLPLVPPLEAVRRPGVRGRAIALLAVGIVAAAAAWPVAKGMIIPRLTTAAQEIEAAVESEEYATSTGLRIRLWEWAWDFYRSEPILGVGAGGFELAQRADPDFARLVAESPEDENYFSRGHAHSMYLQVLACTGTIGGAILAAVIGLALVQTWRDRPDHVFADGSFFALLGWLIGAQFDAYHLNGHLFGLLLLLVAVTLPRRPRATWWRLNPIKTTPSAPPDPA